MRERERASHSTRIFMDDGDAGVDGSLMFLLISDFGLGTQGRERALRDDNQF